MHRLVVQPDVVASSGCDFARVDAVDELSKLVEVDIPEGEGVALAEVVMERRCVVLIKRVAVRCRLKARN